MEPKPTSTARLCTIVWIHRPTTRIRRKRTYQTTILLTWGQPMSQSLYPNRPYQRKEQSNTRTVFNCRKVKLIDTTLTWNPSTSRSMILIPLSYLNPASKVAICAVLSNSRSPTATIWSSSTTTTQQPTPSGSTLRSPMWSETPDTSSQSSTWSSPTPATTKAKNHYFTRWKNHREPMGSAGTETEKISHTTKMRWRKRVAATITLSSLKYCSNMMTTRSTLRIAIPTRTQTVVLCLKDCAPIKPKIRSGRQPWPKLLPVTTVKW